MLPLSVKYYVCECVCVYVRVDMYTSRYLNDVKTVYQCNILYNISYARDGSGKSNE